MPKKLNPILCDFMFQYAYGLPHQYIIDNNSME